MDWKDIQDLGGLAKRRKELIKSTAKRLHKLQMIVFDEKTGYISPKDVGRIACNYYISSETIEIFNASLVERMTEADVIAAVSLASEFSQIKSRDEEMHELKTLLEDPNVCVCVVRVFIYF